MFRILGGAAVVWSSEVPAQQSPGKVWRVAFLYPGSVISAADREYRELRKLGYIEGKNLELERIIWRTSKVFVFGNPYNTVLATKPAAASCSRQTLAPSEALGGVAETDR